MLDLSDRHVPGVPAKGSSHGPVPGEINPPRPGQLFRHYKGGLYRIVGNCTIEDTLECGVLYRAVDPQARQDTWMRPIREFSTQANIGSAERFSLIREADPSALRKFFPETLISAETLEKVLSSYDEPWRFFHSREHIHDMFSKALSRGINLTPEQSLAILFHDLVYVPGAAEGQNERQSTLLMQTYKQYIAGVDLDWELVATIISDTATHTATTEASKVVLDLDISNLGESPTQFCAVDEMVWLESRHLLATENARQDFDTRRLRFLLALAEKGPLFSAAMADLEDGARVNLEGLRQAWIQKYGPTRG